MTRFLTILTIYFTLTTVTAFGQTERKISFHNFIKQFPKISLPDTIQYSSDEFDYGYYKPDYEQNGEDSANYQKVIDTTTTQYQNSVLPKSDSLIITYDLVKSFLLTDTEQVTVYWSEDFPDTMYYFTKNLFASKNFYCVVYESQYYYNGSSYCQKYLCTLGKKGKLIDKIKVASANYSGTGILGDGYRVPWYPDEKSIVTQDLKIFYFKEGIQFMTTAGSDKVELRSNNIYQIDNKGKIKKIK